MILILGQDVTSGVHDAISQQTFIWQAKKYKWKYKPTCLYIYLYYGIMIQWTRDTFQDETKIPFELKFWI